MKRCFWILVLGALVGCNAGHNQTNIELVQNMMDEPNIKSQDWVPQDGDKGQMRMPPDHTISRGHVPDDFAGDPGAADKARNPFAGQMSPEVLSVGRHYFEIYCSICHGHDGAGDGTVAVKMAVKPRDLVTADAKGYTDGRIYYAMTYGRGVMRPYASQIPDRDVRWKIVNYVRSLQKQK
jgi:mono/diheme cytochrome c family protein